MESRLASAAEGLFAVNVLKKPPEGKEWTINKGGNVEIFIIWFVSVVIGGLVGMSKGQESAGVLLSLLLGPLGVLIVLALPNKVKEAAATAQHARELKLIQLQQAQLQELRELRKLHDSNPALPSPPVIPPLPPEPVLEDFIPESLQARRFPRR